MTYRKKKSNKNKDILTGSYWFNNRRKHPCHITNSNNNNYFENHLITHTRKSPYDIELDKDPKIGSTDSRKSYYGYRKYVETSKDAFGKKINDFEFTESDLDNINKLKKK